MSMRWLTLVPLLCGLPTAAHAQQAIGTSDNIQLTPLVSLELARINIEDLVEDEADPARIELEWSLTGLAGTQALDYRLTYGAISESNPEPELVRVNDSDGFAEAEDDQPLVGATRVELRLRNVIGDPEDLPPELGGNGRDDYNESICVNVFPAGNPDFNQTFSNCWTFEVDTLAPPAPRITELVPGENRILVRWERLDDNDIDFYEIVYCTNASTTTVSFEELPCATPRESGTISETQSEASISNGIRVGQRVVVAMRSIDEFNNEGEPGEVEDAVSVAVDDFFELYEGPEEGGFCFIATAAYGSYAHPMVRVLRAFRDGVLDATPLGAAFVWAYYHYAPPLAERVAADPSLAAWIRLWLVPIVVVAFLIMMCPVVAVGWMLRRSWRSLRRAAAGGSVAAVVAVVAVPGAAEASRPDSDLKTVGVGLEFKGGPYSGAIQADPAFAQVFNDESRPLFSLGVDLQVLRGFGTVTIGGTFGFLQYTGKALFGKGAERPDTPSSDTNVFNIVPLTLQLGYRFDWLADRTWFPLVPYARGGLAYYIWWATDGIGNIQRRTDPETDDRLAARGGTFGLTGTVGVAFMLNKIEPRVAQSLFANTGIRGTYIFVELTRAEVNDFNGDSFDLSDINWAVGLYMEL